MKGTTMKKYFINMLLAILVVFTLSTSAMAFSTWGVDLNSGDPGGLISGIDKLTYVATSLVNSTTSAGEDGDFAQLTAVKITDVNTADGVSLAPRHQQQLSDYYGIYRCW